MTRNATGAASGTEAARGTAAAQGTDGPSAAAGRRDLGRAARRPYASRSAAAWRGLRAGLAVLARGTALGLGASLLLPLGVASAQDMFVPAGSEGFMAAELLELVIFSGAVLASGFFAYRLMQERRQLLSEVTALRSRAGELAADNGRLATLADARDRRIVVWSDADGDEGRPALFGDLPAETGAPSDRGTFLGFGRWMRPHSAGLLEHAVRALREEGTPFDLTIETVAGAPLEVEGRTGGMGRFVRFLPTHASRRAETDLRARAQRLESSLERIETLTGDLAHPTWTRDREGRLDWANGAFAQAVGADTGADAVERALELFGETARETVARDLGDEGGTFRGKLSTTVDGERRVFQVQETRTAIGTAGVAVDVTEAEEAEGTLARTRRAHAETMDQLATAVVSFDQGARLTHWNGAFARLWDLDAAFLETAPSNSALLERLRADGKLPESPAWREWVDELMGVYHSTDPQEHQWHTPDGRSIRVVAAPQEGGGVTWLFENMTEALALKSRATELQRTRDASLEHLGEGVAVFGPDGRLRLANPAFGKMWGLPDDRRESGTHVSAIAAACANRFETPSTLWADLVERITTFDDARAQAGGQVRLKRGEEDGTGIVVLDWSAQPLPSGQTLLTFFDMSDTVRVADALRSRNEAMAKADQMKSAFLGHVSYELRSPLTNIIGFTDLLQAEAAGPVTERQTEYLGHIVTSSESLLTTVDEIIDLATIDAGEMELARGPVKVDELIADVAVAIEERLEDHDLVLDVIAAPGLGEMVADGERLAQVLRNLLLNAIDHTPDGGTLTFAVSRTDGGAGEGGDSVVFSVTDEGQGIPDDIAPRVFEPFVQQPGEGRTRGAGLGLAVVRAFVSLHGGDVSLDTGPGGTTVTCSIPVHGGTVDDKPEPRASVLRADPVRMELPGPAPAPGSVGTPGPASAARSQRAGRVK